MKRVLVTGAAGFIGSHLTETLIEQDYEVTALVKYNSNSSIGSLACLLPKKLKEVKIVFGDVRDPGQMKQISKNVDVILHLAALIAIPFSYVAPESYLQTNLLGTQHLLEAAVLNSVPLFIHTSTSEVYGNAQYVPIDERHPKVGQSPYSASKIGTDALVESYHRCYGLPTITLRPFNNFGPRQSGRAVIPTIISQALHGDSIRLGDVSTKRDFLYVKDTANAYTLAIKYHKKALGQSLNLGTGVNYSMSEIVTAVGKILNRHLKITVDKNRLRPAKSEVNVLLSSSKLAKELISWRPQIDLTAGLTTTVNWIRKNLAMYQADKYTI